MSRTKLLLGLAGMAVSVGFGAVWLLRNVSKRPDIPSPAQVELARFVGRQACVKCHQEQDTLWRGSDHDLAMQVANEKTVLGDFGNATFRYRDVTSTFFKKDGRFHVRTDGPDGRLHEYPIAYTFGVRPLQQYLIEFPAGRYQALSICWDSRPAKDGGQRWFHLYPNETVASEDILHWTGPYQNWNFMCADCHSTNVKRNYRPEEDRYETTWSEINVSCETCHGAGSRHVAWGEAVEKGQAPREDDDDGLLAHLKDRASWEIDIATGIAKRYPARQSHIEVEICAPCHSRRAVIDDKYEYGRPFLDTYRPMLLEETLYHPDGQIKEEVYEYASFLQSKMYEKGVSCSDCHDPHSLKVAVGPDVVCVRCHLREKFTTPAHHFHKPTSPGASCVECHMPAQKYMVVDPRRDHSFRIPRPDLSERIGTPNACNQCHRDRSTRWAAETLARWRPARRSHEPHYGEALHAARARLPNAQNALVELVEDQTKPGIVRATAVSLLGRFLGPGAVGTVERSLQDPDPVVRSAALPLVSTLEPELRVRLACPLLGDPIRAVRMEAATALVSAPLELMTDEQRARLRSALDEYRNAQRVNADRPEGRLNLAVLHIELGELDRAEREYKKALALSPKFPLTYVHLTDLYRRMGRDREGEKVLRQGLIAAPKEPEIHHALGLVLVRQRRLAEALSPLERAAELRPEEPRYAYVFGVALESAGETERALKVLESAQKLHPGDRDLLFALASVHREEGSLAQAIHYAKSLLELDPQDPGARQLLAELQSQRR